MKKISLFVLTCFVLSGFAGPNRKAVRRHQAAQHKRIQEGVKSGELTKEEAQKLRSEQKEIREEKREALKNDGKIDGQERKELRDAQRDASKEIHEEKNDADKK